MNTNKLRLVAACLVKSHLGEEFRAFMEQTHHKTMHASGCFTDVIRRVFNPEVKPGLDSVVYIHEPIDWEKYCKEFRPAAVEEFLGKYSDAVKNGDIIIVQSMGELEVI